MNQYIIVETIFEKEYKIGFKSYRLIGDIDMYALLDDTYFLCEIGENSFKTMRINRFASQILAEAAIQELLSPKYNK